MSNTKQTVKIIIPARLRSTRFPKKILAEIKGKTLLEHTYHQAVASGLGDVWIAVDDPEVKALAENFGAKVCMTEVSHISGTSRLSEVVRQFNWHPEEIILNWQADEPLLPIRNAQQVIELLEQELTCPVATLCEPIDTLQELSNPNITKVVKDVRGRALYFSRAMIPWERGYFPESIHMPNQHFRHIGLYAYRVKFLLDFPKLPECEIEIMEGLEQLRFLYAGYGISVGLAHSPSVPGVDVPEDLWRIEKLI